MAHERNTRTSTIQEAVYNVLKEGIMTLQLEPGSVMHTQEIAAKLNVSRTPVREAFIKLQREGLVLVMPQKETVISKINLERVEQELFIRSSLELSLAERLKTYKDDIPFGKLEENLSEQEKCLVSLDFREFFKLDNDFHSTLFTAAREKLSWDTIMSVNGHYNRVRVYMTKEKEQMKAFIEEHRSLLNAARENRWDEFYKLVGMHIKTDINKKMLVEKQADYFVLKEETSEIRLLGSL